jgi:hypothetical protein
MWFMENFKQYRDEQAEKLRSIRYIDKNAAAAHLENIKETSEYKEAGQRKRGEQTEDPKERKATIKGLETELERPKEKMEGQENKIETEAVRSFEKILSDLNKLVPELNKEKWFTDLGDYEKEHFLEPLQKEFENLKQSIALTKKRYYEKTGIEPTIQNILWEKPESRLSQAEKSTPKGVHVIEYEDLVDSLKNKKKDRINLFSVRIMDARESSPGTTSIRKVLFEQLGFEKGKDFEALYDEYNQKKSFFKKKLGRKKKNYSFTVDTNIPGLYLRVHNEDFDGWTPKVDLGFNQDAIKKFFN